MKHQTLAFGSIIAVGIIAIVICVGMVSGSSVFKPFITVDPVGEKNIGDQFTITGTASLPAGSEILVEVYPASFKDQNGTGSGNFYGSIGLVSATSGSGNTRAWSMDVNTSKLSPGTYLVKASLFKGDIQKGDFTTSDPIGTAQCTLN